MLSCNHFFLKKSALNYYHDDDNDVCSEKPRPKKRGGGWFNQDPYENFRSNKRSHLIQGFFFCNERKNKTHTKIKKAVDLPCISLRSGNAPSRCHSLPSPTFSSFFFTALFLFPDTLESCMRVCSLRHIIHEGVSCLQCALSLSLSLTSHRWIKQLQQLCDVTEVRKYYSQPITRALFCPRDWRASQQPHVLPVDKIWQK